MENPELSHTAGGSVSWCSHFGKLAVTTEGKYIEVLCPAISILDIQLAALRAVCSRRHGSLIHNSPKVEITKCLSTIECVNCHTFIQECEKHTYRPKEARTRKEHYDSSYMKFEQRQNWSREPEVRIGGVHGEDPQREPAGCWAVPTSIWVMVTSLRDTCIHVSEDMMR